MMDIREIMRKAFNLGQTYWHQADSESYSQNKKADATLQKFEELLLAASIDSHQARLQYDALLEALEAALLDIERLCERVDSVVGSLRDFDQIVEDGEAPDSYSKIIAAIAAAKGE